ncbi:lipid A ethanolaminephosphotransferase [Faunimonas pinastri]|uniref:Lipid A ethanolaminephosphotransferase n=1 Tax=Faunimonas pinastri TaxID=1855383 RepID=A0A1H9QUE8_9HYPH|nr:phosphoethanolamine--lipid A transferase [Faunimonas pinastri]SER64241.1 lipid A ethanolaminephosphotransferase [Faunimonas pinastri]
MYRPKVTSNALAFIVSAYFVLLTNFSFWSKGLTYFQGHTVQLAFFVVGLYLLLTAILTLFTMKYVIKPVFIAAILISAVASYYVDTFGILIDRDMIQNVFLTTPSEAKHLITFDMLAHIVVFGLIPSLLVVWVRVTHRNVLAKAAWNTLVITPCLLAVVAILMANYSTYASTIRAHNDLIDSFNPSAPIVATAKFVQRQMKVRDIVAQPLGTDARAGANLANAPHKVVTVFVVGETARAANFSMIGYDRDTNPELAARKAIAFSHVTSCGTATAVSVPCMFSVYPREHYSEAKARATQNLTDVLTHAGINVSWFDNDTGSMRVAENIPYEFLPNTDDKRFCKGGECHDDILVDRLKRQLDDVKGNAVIILHELGSHGPAYYERYPKKFQIFKPACETVQFADCTHQEIVNSYDNTILYTDHVLSEVIDLLKERNDMETSMIYVSDHGESLGENGLYLHGAPYFMAPDFQTHVPLVAWFSDGYRRAMGLDVDCVAGRRDAPLSHDNMFHTLLGMMDVVTSVYDPKLDAFAACRQLSPNITMSAADGRAS